MQNYYYYPKQAMPLRPPELKGRPVASIEEAKASPIDFDSSLYIFTNISNSQIYTKQLNVDGTISFDVYEKVPPAPLPYVTREELEQIVADLMKKCQPRSVSL